MLYQKTKKEVTIDSHATIITSLFWGWVYEKITSFLAIKISLQFKLQHMAHRCHDYFYCIC